MAFETREELLKKIIKKEKPVCPHCQQEMKLWEVPPINFSDGLGWGTPYLYICFNDECPLYVSGWKNLKDNYAQTASYRCIKDPSGGGFECMPVFSPMGGTGQIVDQEVMAMQEREKEMIKLGFSTLAEAYVSKDYLVALNILLDAEQPNRVRAKAAEIVGDVGDIEAIDPLRNYKFGNRIVQENVEEAIGKIHERHFTRECPFCAEIIKKKAKICKHCGKEVAGL